MRPKKLIQILFPLVSLLYTLPVAIPLHVAGCSYGMDSIPSSGGHRKSHDGKSISSYHDSMQLMSALDNEYYMPESANRTIYLYTETRVGKSSNSKLKRVPLNIALVLDKSGSMQGEKMDFAKKAAKGIVESLSEDDYVSLTVYDDEVELIQPAVHPVKKDIIKAKIDSIKPRGATNLWGGTETGYYQVLSKFQPRFVNRVLLISDGLVNQGVTSSKAIQSNVTRFKNENGITISTFGVGLDYNEVLMTQMAEAGSGNYFFIDRPEKMEEVFNKEINGLLNVAAQNAELTIQLPAGTKLEKVYPLPYELTKDMVTLKFRDLFSGETRGILLKLTLPAEVKTPLRFPVRLNYVEVGTGQKKTLSNENVLSPSKSAETYFRHFNKTTIEQVLLYTSNERMEAALNDADKGNYDRALTALRANEQYLKENAEYVSSSRILQQMDSLNKGYAKRLLGVKTTEKDSVKMVQKESRAASYKIRHKKQ